MRALCFLTVTLCLYQSNAFVSPSNHAQARCTQQSALLPLKTLANPISTPAESSTTTNTAQQPEQQVTNGRPFHQQWWPVAAVTSLNKDRPNELQLLGKNLVAFWNGTSWNILDDACSHRFAPLSEGRVVVDENSDNNSCKLQCAYHGWEFDSTGECTKVPQEPTQTNKARAVQSYPVREEISMLWVWMDPDSYDSLGESIVLPVNPYLKERVEELGPNSCFQRDLPYGMEILGENLLDLAHLPFAHHSVGGLTRNMGGALPTRMLSQTERESQSEWEYEYAAKDYHKPVLPAFQAEIVDAAQYDPLLMGAAQNFPNNVTDSWLTTIGYYEPCHVRYRRDRGAAGGSHVELFFCPTAEGRSRVFLFNTIRQQTTPPPEKNAPLKEKVAYYAKPSTWKQKAFAAMIKKVLTSERGHMMSHSIFDGDGIFLHKQGNRMKTAGKTYRDYSTPSSADVLLNSYRRFLDQAAQRTKAAGLEDMAQSVVGDTAYGNDAARAILLDRYNTHTKNCPLCLGALRKARRKKARLQVLQTALQGAMGASSLALAILASLSGMDVPIIKPALRKVALALIGSVAASWIAKRKQAQLESKINAFIFEDYVHADKI